MLRMRWSVLLALVLVSCLHAVSSQDGENEHPVDHVPEEPASTEPVAKEDDEEDGVEAEESDEETGDDDGDLRESHTPPKKPKKKKNKPVFVPVPVQKKKKKDKIISITQGMYIPGGQPLYGKFKTLKSCAKACSKVPNCFSVDYDKWTHKCFMHGNTTSCTRRLAHPSITHLAKVPCFPNDLPVGAPGGRVVLGAAMAFGLEMKGIDSLKGCIKKCVTLGGGVATAPTAIQTQGQLCVAINFDFAAYKCYIFPQFPDGILNICRTSGTALTPYTPRSASRLLYSSENVVTIFLCPPNTMGASATL